MAEKRPRLSGFCNPTLPRGPGYDPCSHCWLEGCTHSCHTDDGPVSVDLDRRDLPALLMVHRPDGSVARYVPEVGSP